MATSRISPYLLHGDGVPTKKGKLFYALIVAKVLHKYRGLETVEVTANDGESFGELVLTITDPLSFEQAFVITEADEGLYLRKPESNRAPELKTSVANVVAYMVAQIQANRVLHQILKNPAILG